MKVLHIIDSLATGGAEKLIVDVIPLINSKNISADVALLDGKETPFFKELREKDVNKIYILGVGSVYNPLLIFKIIPLLKKYDLIHVHLFPAQYWVVFAKWISFSSTKLIFTEHSTNNRRLSNPFFRVIEKLLYKAYSKIICITDEVSDTLKRHLNIPENKLITIQNGVNLKKIDIIVPMSRSYLGFSDNDILLIMVAGFRPVKDQDTIIRSLVELPDNIKLLFVGDGERKAECQKLVGDLDLQHRISFLGNRTDVYALIKMCDISILSSHWEGFGLAAVESMASGIPLIASNVDGLAQVVGNKDILFEKGSSFDLSNKIQKLISDKKFYHDVAEEGRIRARQFDINFMVEKLLHLYSGLIYKDTHKSN